MKRVLGLLLTLTMTLVVAGVGPTEASHEIVVGLQCDRTGATQVVGVNLCPGYHDYVALVNSKGGIEGHRIRAIEIDHEYKVPPAVESYERMKKDGAVLIGLYGTPQTYALTQKLTEDKIPGTSPGFGRADATDGTRYPYIFPIAATYWSQGAAAVDFAKKHLKAANIQWIHGDARTWRSNTLFQAAVMIEALEHIVEWQAALANIALNLVNGGHLFVSARNAHADLRRNWLHEREWTAREFRDALSLSFGRVQLFDWTLNNEQDETTRLTPLIAVATK